MTRLFPFLDCFILKVFGLSLQHCNAKILLEGDQSHLDFFSQLLVNFQEFFFGQHIIFGPRRIVVFDLWDDLLPVEVSRLVLEKDSRG